MIEMIKGIFLLFFITATVFSPSRKLKIIASYFYSILLSSILFELGEQELAFFLITVTTLCSSLLVIVSVTLKTSRPDQRMSFRKVFNWISFMALIVISLLFIYNFLGEDFWLKLDSIKRFSSPAPFYTHSRLIFEYGLFVLGCLLLTMMEVTRRKK